MAINVHVFYAIQIFWTVILIFFGGEEIYILPFSTSEFRAGYNTTDNKI